MGTGLYFDHNATAPILPAARDAMIMALDAANPFSPHAAGREAAMMIDRARRSVAGLADVDPRTVIFTSGATEANAWALGHRDGPVLTSAIEHPSALAWASETIPVDDNGVIDLDWLSRRLSAGWPEGGVVSVMAANNETGVLQPVGAVAALVRAVGGVFHCDATQIPGRLPMAIDADLLTLSAHKFGGPKGVGALIVKTGVAPLLRGGPQERGLRAGTHNVPGIVGMGAAALACGEMAPQRRDALVALCRSLGGEVLGEGAPRLPNTLSVLFNAPGDLIVMALDLEGVSASTGSACSSGSAQPSHVLAAMGKSGTPVRLSFGPQTDIEPLKPILARVISNLEQSQSCEW
ncbi:MAG: cysteine desulfurase family protein [Myxococcota bacterium]